MSRHSAVLKSMCCRLSWREIKTSATATPAAFLSVIIFGPKARTSKEFMLSRVVGVASTARTIVPEEASALSKSLPGDLGTSAGNMNSTASPLGRPAPPSSTVGPGTSVAPDPSRLGLLHWCGTSSSTPRNLSVVESPCWFLIIARPSPTSLPSSYRASLVSGCAPVATRGSAAIRGRPRPPVADRRSLLNHWHWWSWRSAGIPGRSALPPLAWLLNRARFSRLLASAAAAHPFSASAHTVRISPVRFPERRSSSARGMLQSAPLSPATSAISPCASRIQE